jgi:hypothetical protein
MTATKGWCYGPVLCEKQTDGTVEMTCADWAAPNVPCQWTHTARNTAMAALVGHRHAATHRS